MCNIYQIDRKKGARAGISSKVSDAAEKMVSPMVRKSDPGLVVLAGERVELMRWGFHRNFNAAINNARSDKLGSGMWADALRERRCVIPLSVFYEWGPGVGGHKQAHAFRDPEEDYLWVAGLWESGGELGPCFTMVTPDAPPLMAPIHSRMPAVLSMDEADGFLDGGDSWNFRPYTGKLSVSPCPSPLKGRVKGGGQGELF